MPDTLSARLTIWYISAFSVFLVAAFGTMFVAINGILNYRMDADLIEDLEEFREMLAEDGISRVVVEIEREANPGSTGSIYLRLLSRDGHLVFASDMSMFELEPTDMEWDAQYATLDEPILRTREFRIQEDGETERENFREILGSLNDEHYIQIGESLEEKEEMMDTILMSFVVILFLVLPVAGFVGWLISRNAMKGIEDVARTEERINRGRLDERVNIVARDREIIDLSSTFNAMLDRIGDLIREMREMTDNIAHDLKSPLSRIRIISEEALSSNDPKENPGKAAAQTIEECDRLLRMINDSLDVAEAEAGIMGNGQQLFDMSNLVSEACDLFGPVADLRGITLTCEISPGCEFYGNRQVFERSISNLIDNAIKYTDTGGKIEMYLDYTDETCTIRVSDTGIGISEEDQTRIYNRFYRGDQSRSEDGCGLGLSYTRAVIRNYGGDISLASTVNRGSTFTLTLPTAQS